MHFCVFLRCRFGICHDCFQLWLRHRSQQRASGVCLQPRFFMFQCLCSEKDFCIVHTVDSYSFIYAWSQVGLKKNRQKKNRFQWPEYIGDLWDGLLDEQNVLLMPCGGRSHTCLNSTVKSLSFRRTKYINTYFLLAFTIWDLCPNNLCKYF